MKKKSKTKEKTKKITLEELARKIVELGGCARLVGLDGFCQPGVCPGYHEFKEYKGVCTVRRIGLTLKPVTQTKSLEFYWAEDYLQQLEKIKYLEGL